MKDFGKVRSTEKPDELVTDSFSVWVHTDITPISENVGEENEFVGFVELNKEWNQRLRITNIFVKEEKRHDGIGTILMKHAKAYAASQNMRGIVLETQSYNVPAIRFYQKHGFLFLGCDLSAFSNEDVKHQEIRLEMCYQMENS